MSSSSPASSQTHIVTIEGLAQGGEGVGRLDDGRVVFVPRTIPGERVEIETTEDHTDYLRARLLEILDPSEDRIEPECPYFERCGGCQFWHVQYEREWRMKMNSALERIEDIGELELPEPQRVAAPEDRRYRTRVEMHRRRTDPSSSAWSVGFFEPESHEIVPIDDCLVTTESLNEARHDLEPALEDVGDLDLLLETADSTSAVVTLLPDQWQGEPPPSLREFASQIHAIETIRGVRIVGDDREWVIGDDSVDGGEVLADSPVTSMRLPAGLFRQANPTINTELAEAVCRAADAHGAEDVLELFCGVGNLSFALRETVSTLVGLERTSAAVEMAETLTSFVQLEAFRFLEADLSEGYRRWLVEADRNYDTVLLDPPRGGAPEVCEELQSDAAETILYISCDPPALGRDLATLQEGGWEPIEVTMFDMFPRTSHLEVLTVLTR